MIFRLKGTEKIHTKRFAKFPSSIYSILYATNFFVCFPCDLKKLNINFFGYFIVRTDEDQHRPKDSVKNVELATFLLCKVWSIISTLSTPNLKRNHGSRKLHIL